MSGRQRLWPMLKAYRWPLLLTGLMIMSVTAQGILVFVATRPDAPRPTPGFYERSRHWEDDEALRAASAQLGWSVTFQLPTGPEYAAGMPRPVDVRVRDRNGQGVTGLAGELVAVRPSDARLDSRGTLVALPHVPGDYRALVRLDAAGLWSLRLDARQGALRFVHEARQTLPADEPLGEAGR